MPTSRCVALAFDPHTLDRQQRELLAGIHRFAERAPHWQCVFSPYAIWHLPGPYHGVLAPGGTHTAPRCARAGVPAVLVTWLAFDTPGAVRAAANRWMAARLAAEHLHQRGYRSFACVGVRHYSLSRIDRKEFRRWLRERGLSAAERRVTQRRLCTSRDWGDELGRLRSWLGTLTPPVGIFCAHDALARTLAHLGAERRLRVPQDVGLIGGGNDVPLCELEEPTLTSIDYHWEQVGYRAAQLLDRLMDGDPPPPRNVLIPPTLVPRRSTDLRGLGDPIVARALGHIAAHLADPIRAGHVAEAAGLSQRHLERRFKDTRGYTIVQEILRARLDRARHLLVTTDAPISSIARETGFASRRALSAAFRQEFGEPPSTWRQRHRP